MCRGPDLPTGAEIISPRAELKEFYDNGVGSFQRPRDLRDRGDGSIIITALPYQVSATRVLEQIAEQMRAEETADGRGSAR